MIVVWLLAMLSLAAFGRDLEDKVSTHPIYVDGSVAERAHRIAMREFGSEDALVVMLRGPRAEVSRQGSQLVHELKAMPETLVISPWSSTGSIGGLRPAPGVAAILISVGRSSTSDAVPAVERVIAEAVGSPVRVSIAGGPAIVDSLLESTTHAVALGQELALPVLLIVLLFVCRSVLAALLPIVIGGLVVGATRGVLSLAAGALTIDSFALGAAAMLGLALGVDYSLLVVSRFRQEREKGTGVERAVEATALSTGRSILPAGCGLVLTMLVSLFLLPSSLITSVAFSVIAATALSVLSALLLAPATLALFGARLDRWSLPRRRPSGSVVAGWSRQLSRRPGVVLGLIFVLMLCGVWALTLKTSTGTASLLPPGDPGRTAQEEIEHELGPGWVAPFEVVMTGGDRPVTTPKRLDALAAFQRKVERDPGVEAMAGFASLERARNALGSVEGTLATQERGAARLSRGLGQLHSGATATAGGFSQAAGGASRLAAAVDAAHVGSSRLAKGLRAGSTGSARLSGGLARASDGSGRLSDATTKVSSGADALADKVQEARKQTSEAVGSSRTLKNALRRGEQALRAAPLAATEGQLGSAWQALQRMTTGRGDPQYAAALDAIRAASRELSGAEPEGEEEGKPTSGVAVELQHALNQFGLGLYLAERQDKSGNRARDGLDKLAKASARLDRGLRKLRDSSQELSDGIGRLSRRGEALPPGLQRLADGTDQLVAGLGAVSLGTERLASGLDGGAQRSQQLTGGVDRLKAGVERQRRSSSPREGSPGLFRSGYFYLAGLDGSRPEQRNQANFLVNLDQGGTTARMLVVPKAGPATSDVNETGDRLSSDAAALARRTGGEVVVGGLPPSLDELNVELRDQGPLLRFVLLFVTIAILIPVTRSLTLPILAALLNLLTVSAAFGLVALLFNDSLLGGPGFVDTMVIPAGVILTFGLAIDYEVFIFARVREEYVRTGSSSQAIVRGFAQTAHVISGAAMIMIAVFFAFSVSPLANLRNVGVCLAIGVFIDAFVVRLVILPAVMQALGDRCWWLPKWLDRILPGQAPSRAAVEA